jgi:hypothetical protein
LSPALYFYSDWLWHESVKKKSSFSQIGCTIRTSFGIGCWICLARYLISFSRKNGGGSGGGAHLPSNGILS